MSIHHRFNVSHTGSLSALVGGATVHAAGLDDDTGIVALQVETNLPEQTPSSALRADQSRFNGLLTMVNASRKEESAPAPTKSKKGKKPAPALRRSASARMPFDPRLAPTPRTKCQLAQMQKNKLATKATKPEMRFLRGQLAAIALKQMGAIFPGSLEGNFHPDYLKNVWIDPYGRPVRYYELLKQPSTVNEPKPASTVDAPKPAMKISRTLKKNLFLTLSLGGSA